MATQNQNNVLDFQDPGKLDEELLETQFYVSEGNFDRLKKRALGLLEKNGGRMDRSQLLRNLPIDAATLRRLIMTLKVCDLVEDEVIPSGKVVLLLKKAA